MDKLLILFAVMLSKNIEIAETCIILRASLADNDKLPSVAGHCVETKLLRTKLAKHSAPLIGEVWVASGVKNCGYIEGENHLGEFYTLGGCFLFNILWL